MNIKKYESQYHKFIFIFRYDHGDVAIVKQIQADLGWQALSYFADDRVKGWAFSSLKLVLPELLRHFTIDLSDEVLKELSGEKEGSKVEIVQDNLTAELIIPTKLPLFDFQIKTIDFINKAEGKALLALDMGTGKTICAIGYGAYKRYGRVLIICPASMKETWKREVEKFSGIEANMLTDDETGGWEIINYDQLNKYSPYLYQQDYDLVVCDESHMLKNKKAIRTKVAFKVLQKSAKDVLFLTGTPIMNRPIEIYTTFNFITPMNYFEFCQEYCGAKQTSWGWDFNGASNLGDLKEKMWWMIRMKKEDVLEDLPDKTINILNTKMKSRSDYNKILKDFRSWLLEKDLSTNALYAEALTKINYLKQIIVENKNLKDIIDNFLDNDKKLIVFSQYKTVIDKLHEEYKDISVKLTGDTKAEERQEAVDVFQKSDEKRIFLSTIKAGGVGITLTKADTVIFTDLSWTPADHKQAEDRAYRIGQKNNVNVYYLITNNTVEDKIWAMLKRKEKMVHKIMEGEDGVRKVHIKSLLKSL